MKSLILLIAVLAIIAQILTPILVGLFYPSLESRALFGDSFGITNSIFSLLAILAILFTITSQHAEDKKNSENMNNSIKLNALATLLKVSDSKLKYFETDIYRSNLIKKNIAEDDIDKTKNDEIDLAKKNRKSYQKELDEIFESLDWKL